MNLKNFAIFIKEIFGCCYIYIQTVKLDLTGCFSFVNFSFFETLCESWLDSQMHPRGLIITLSLTKSHIERVKHPAYDFTNV